MRVYEIHGKAFRVSRLPSGEYLVTTGGARAGYLVADEESGDLRPSGRYANVTADGDLEALAKVVADDPQAP
jgi:hypothetical protein